ncbi:MAG TPA: M56 family metallopeptidase [Puia sp.]|nr:M56 family metallopeptidase [Puia sp.]
MRISFLLSLFREDLVRALLWTLVHSLWQGLALAILTGLVILFTRRSAPVWRYNLLLCLLCLFIAGAGTTFFLLLETPGATVGAVSGGGAAFYTGPGDVPVAGALYAGSELSRGDRLTLYFNQRADLIVAIWFIILAIRLVKLLTDLWAVQRLRYYRASVPAAYWSERVRELAQRIGIKRAVTILESAVVKTPMMAGMFKPVILTPLGLLAQLPSQEVEAMLLHELAHIRRKDYLTNLLQCFAEVLFFFNPAVLWISSLIREERENCCDDIAVGEAHSKRDLINALVSFQEYNHSNYTLAFAGGKDHLLRRVKRIVHRDDRTLNIREKFFLLACLFITAGLTLAYTHQTPAPIKKAKEGTAKVETIWQAPPVEDVPFTDKVQQEKPTKMVRAVAADTSKKPSATDTAAAERDRKRELMLEKQRAALEMQQQRLNEEQAKLDERLQELNMEQAKLKLQYLQADRDTLPFVYQMELEKLRLAHAQINLDRVNHRDVELLARNQRQLRENELRVEGLARMQSHKLLEARNMFDRNKTLLLRSSDATRRLVNSKDEIIKPFLRMLMEKELVTQVDEVSFSLDNKELIVNDKKQPKEVFEAFRDRFIHSDRDYIKYSKHEGSESSSISQHSDR